MDESKIKDDEVYPDNDVTIANSKADMYDKTLTVRKEDRIDDEKSTSSFKIDDITKKLQSEIDDIPELDMEEMQTGQMSGIIKSIFPERTKAEQIKINRNFLRDAEPFKIERLLEEVKNRPQGLASGFSGLDNTISIPNSAVTAVTGAPRHGKSLFMLNVLLNMAHMYKDRHFLFFTYEELRRDIEIKLINMSGDTPFSEKKNLETNLSRWKNEFRTRDTAALMDKGNNHLEYIGLGRFLQVSQGIHIIDSNYDIRDLIDAVRSFNNTFTIGAVFIDFFQKIKADRKRSNLSRSRQLQEIAEELRMIANEIKIPIICGTQFPYVEKGIPEYDILLVDNLKEAGGIEQASNLIIGLQNYSRSRYIGSNINENFKSKLYDHRLLKAEKMQENFDSGDSETILLAKVLLNREGLEPEVELLFHRDLLKLRDLKDGDIKVLKKNLI
ncbi:MAG: hypothetical protein KAW12_13790 [Candidatus Aminicenantes bacterium]|nr:hypothetical protein [Candidatus Aminicenantes bacterium]